MRLLENYQEPLTDLKFLKQHTNRHRKIF